MTNENDGKKIALEQAIINKIVNYDYQAEQDKTDLRMIARWKREDAKREEKRKLKEEKKIKPCSDCQDEQYRSKYLHYIYLDNDSPKWTCAKHPNYDRKWACITHPDWARNLTNEDKK